MSVAAKSTTMTGRALKAGRVYAGLSQGEFAKKALTTQASISRLEAYDLRPIEAEPRLLDAVERALTDAGIRIEPHTGSIHPMPSSMIWAALKPKR